MARRELDAEIGSTDEAVGCRSHVCRSHCECATLGLGEDCFSPLVRQDHPVEGLILFETGCGKDYPEVSGSRTSATEHSRSLQTSFPHQIWGAPL